MVRTALMFPDGLINSMLVAGKVDMELSPIQPTVAKEKDHSHPFPKSLQKEIWTKI